MVSTPRLVGFIFGFLLLASIMMFDNDRYIAIIDDAISRISTESHDTWRTPGLKSYRWSVVVDMIGQIYFLVVERFGMIRL